MVCRACLSRSLFIAFALLLAPACITLKEDSPQVVERSKRVAPKWVNLAPKFFHESAAQYSFITVKSDVIDLPLGIRQAQMGALVDSENALHDQMRRELMDMADNENLQLVSRKQLDDRIAGVVDRNHGEIAQIADIYYEKLGQPGFSDDATNANYKIYVLVQIRQDRMVALLAQLREQLSKARQADLVALSKVITRQNQ